MISPPSACASAIDSAVLPTAVGPTIANSGLDCAVDVSIDTHDTRRRHIQFRMLSRAFVLAQVECAAIQNGPGVCTSVQPLLKTATPADPAVQSQSREATAAPVD